MGSNSSTLTHTWKLIKQTSIVTSIFLLITVFKYSWTQIYFLRAHKAENEIEQTHSGKKVEALAHSIAFTAHWAIFSAALSFFPSCVSYSYPLHSPMGLFLSSSLARSFGSNKRCTKRKKKGEAFSPFLLYSRSHEQIKGKKAFL